MLQNLQFKEPRMTWSMLGRKEDDTREEPSLSKLSYSLSHHTRVPVSIIYYSAWSMEQALKQTLALILHENTIWPKTTIWAMDLFEPRYGQHDIERSKKGLIICLST